MYRVLNRDWVSFWKYSSCLLSLSLTLSLPRTMRKLKLSIEPAFSFFVFLSSYLLPHVIFYTNISNNILAHGNVCLANFGSRVGFLTNICNYKLRIFLPRHSWGVHIFFCDRNHTPLLNFLEHQKFHMISESIFCIMCFGQSIIIQWQEYDSFRYARPQPRRRIKHRKQGYGKESCI